MSNRAASELFVSRAWRSGWLCAVLLCGTQIIACRSERAALVARGDRQLAAGQVNAAAESYTAALARGPDVRAERGLGLALVALGRWEEAYPKLARYTAAQPDDGAARLGLLSVLVARGRLDEARKEVRMLAAKDPDSLPGLLLLGALANDAEAQRDALARLDAWERRAGGAPAELTRCRDALRIELGSKTSSSSPKAAKSVADRLLEEPPLTTKLPDLPADMQRPEPKEIDEKLSLQLRHLADDAVLKGEPYGDEKCANCQYYSEVDKKISYCWHMKLRILVGAEWWCQWWEKIE